jgi:hypothetical protein
VPGQPSAAARRAVGLPPEGRGESCRPATVTPRRPLPLITGHSAALLSPVCSRQLTKRGPGRQARRAEGAPLKAREESCNSPRDRYRGTRARRRTRRTMPEDRNRRRPQRAQAAQGCRNGNATLPLRPPVTRATSRRSRQPRESARPSPLLGRRSAQEAGQPAAGGSLSPAIRPVPPLKAAAGQDLSGPAFGRAHLSHSP